MGLFSNKKESRLSNVMKQHGFKVKGNTYLRIVNQQVLQQIVLEKNHDNQFTLYFRNNPMLADIFDNIFPVGYISIGMFLFGKDKWWENTKESFAEVIDLVENSLIPFLNRFSSYDGIYEELNDMVRSQNFTNRQEKLFFIMIGYKDFFWLSLLKNDYKLCQMILEKLIDSNEKAAEGILGEEKLSQEEKEGYLQYSEKNRNHLLRIEELLNYNKDEQLMSMIKEKEKQNFKKYGS